jgi:hypothetical protein
VVVFEVPGDRLWPVVESVAGQLFPQLDNEIDARLIKPGRAGVRSARARLERYFAFAVIPRDQSADPSLRHSVLASHPRLAAAFNDNSGNDQASLRHPPNVTAVKLFRCLDTPHSYVLTHHTATPT